jgi:hypothetical protein
VKKILKPVGLFTCLAGFVIIGALQLRDVSSKFGFEAAVGIGLMCLGLFFALGAIAVKQTLEISRRDND